MKKRKFADGGETTDEMPSVKPEGGRFSEDTYARARKYLEGANKDDSTPAPTKKMPKAKVVKADTSPAASEAKDTSDTAKPTKRPGMMARFAADNKRIEDAVKRKREETPDLTMASESTSNPMGKNYGAGRVNPKTQLAYKKGGSIDGIAQRGKTRGKNC